MKLSLERVNHEQLFEIMKITLNAGHSLMIRGGVGIGKTYTVEEYARYKARKMERKFVNWLDLSKGEREELAHNPERLKETYILALFDTLNKLPEDTGGVPVPVNGFIEWKPPMLFWVLSQQGAAGVLFLDEVLQAELAVQKPLADLFLNKQISDLRMAKDVAVVAASNRRTDKCGVIEMLEHAKNRAGHVELIPPTASEWVAWAKSRDKKDKEGNILESRIDYRIIMLVMSCPDVIYQEVGHRAGDAFGTPRSMTILSDLIKDVDHEKNKSLFLRLVASRVGNGIAAKFQDVLNHDMATNGPAILQDPQLFRDSSWDRKVAFSMWLSGHSKGNRKFLRDACQFLNDLGAHDMLDTILYMMKSVVGPSFQRELAGTNKYPQALAALVDMAEAVGSIAK